MTRPGPAPSRIVIEHVSPQIDQGRHPVKRVVGEPVVVAATAFADGHDHLHVVVAHRPPKASGGGAKGWLEVPMTSTNPGLDRWEAAFVPPAVGVHRFEVRAWIDHVATWRDATRRKIEAGVGTPGDLLAGAGLLEALADDAPKREAKALRAVAAALVGGDTSVVTDEAAGHALQVAAQVALRRTPATSSDPLTVAVDAERALFSAWYELFPRSSGPPARPARPARHPPRRHRPARLRRRHGLRRPLPPADPPDRHVVPQGARQHRRRPGPATPAARGPSAAPTAATPRSTPSSGTVDDFGRAGRARRREHGIELALDLAFQCSPDHPWVTEHPEWFRHRPDGSIQYAENPPKKYQDIYPLDFDVRRLARRCGTALLDVVLFWMRRRASRSSGSTTPTPSRSRSGSG